MKNSLFFLGIALVTFTNVCNAKSIVGESLNSFQKDFFIDDNEGLFSTEKAIVVKPTLNEDAETFNPETIIAYNGKTMKETIAEGDKIIENTVSDDLEFMMYEESMKESIALADLIIENSISNETYPLFYERTISDEIAELEMIIENKVTNEKRPLDFKKINSYGIMPNSLDSKRFVGMK